MIGSNAVLDAALALAAGGLPVMPVRADKAPACPGGFKSATADPEVVRTLFSKFPAPLIGISTGPQSDWDVLDVDFPRHPEAARWWESIRNRLPTTRIHGTRSGGLHVIFRAAPGLRCWTAKPVIGVDGRSTGGYIIYWPSAGCPVLCEAEPVDWPEWLLDEIFPNPPAPASAPVPKPVPGYTGDRHYALGALRRAAKAVADAREGCRNESLNHEVWNLARFIPSLLTPQEIADAMAFAGLKAGLTPREVERTIASGLRRGIPA